MKGDKMTIGTLFILVGVVILFTLSVGIFLYRKSSKMPVDDNHSDSVEKIFNATLYDDEII